MIRQAEIRKIAEREKVLQATIDKDWVLGHLLSGIYGDDEFRNKLIFKGGTCLRKCYYPNYRFSEDLDFTLTDPGYLVNQDKIQAILDVLAGQQEILFHLRDFTEISYKDRTVGWDADIRYWGANHRANEQPTPPNQWVEKVKLEIRHYELLVTRPAKKKLIHGYSDRHVIGSLEIPCYSLTEILAEKFRSLIQRKYLAVRDCYDIWYLSAHAPNLDWEAIKRAFHKKAEHKQIEPEAIKNVFSGDVIARVCKDWKRSLGNHLPKGKLPDCEKVIHIVNKLIRHYFS